ncbi:MAG TPA: hypothetical protein VGF28_20510 [Thermoanaerobaculia bacterium]|jgi:DUF4097 and DUF4098 domain-containing protein YvlB
MRRRSFIAVLVLLAGSAAFAQKPVQRSVVLVQKFAVAQGGTFVLENPAGNIDVTGADVTDIEATITKRLAGKNGDALDEAAKLTNLLVGGDPRTRVARITIGTPTQPKSWTAAVHWSVRVPRKTRVRIVSTASDRIRVANVTGALLVRNFNGNVIITNADGGASVESVNGSIVYTTPYPRGHVVLKTLNGHVTATVAANAGFHWNAEAATGDIRTNLPARGAFAGKSFRGSVNAPGGPTLTTHSLMGNIYLLAAGVPSRTAEPIRNAAFPIPPPGPSAAPGGGSRLFKRGIMNGSLKYDAKIGDVDVARVKGVADVRTGAGSVKLGAVTGDCNVRSDGGPLHFGEIHGRLSARTGGGDIFVDSTRSGGSLTTLGGTIRLLYTSGPTRLISGGGDIIVRQAAGAVTAETTSGDVSITVDPAVKGEEVTAKTSKGNVILYVDPKFAADIEATIVTSNPDADTFLSDIPGLSVTRETVAGGTRIRAAGKLNGGGPKVVLRATGGDIRIATGRVGPTVLTTR